MQILFLHICQISIKFSIEKKKKSESYIDLVDRARRKIRSVVSVFLFQGIRIFVETNGPRDQWVAALASNYELLPRERDGKERRKREEWRICERLLVTQLNLRSSRTRSDVTAWWDWPDI